MTITPIIFKNEFRFTLLKLKVNGKKRERGMKGKEESFITHKTVLSIYLNSVWTTVSTCNLLRSV